MTSKNHNFLNSYPLQITSVTKIHLKNLIPRIRPFGVTHRSLQPTLYRSAIYDFLLVFYNNFVPN